MSTLMLAPMKFFIIIYKLPFPTITFLRHIVEYYLLIIDVGSISGIQIESLRTIQTLLDKSKKRK